MSTQPRYPTFDELFHSLTNTPTFQNLEKIFLRTLTKQTITNQRIYEGVYPDASKKAHTFISPSTHKLTISRDALIQEIEDEIDSQISEYLQIYFDQHSVQQYLSEHLGSSILMMDLSGNPSLPQNPYSIPEVSEQVRTSPVVTSSSSRSTRVRRHSQHDSLARELSGRRGKEGTANYLRTSVTEERTAQKPPSSTSPTTTTTTAAKSNDRKASQASSRSQSSRSRSRSRSRFAYPFRSRSRPRWTKKRR